MPFVNFKRIPELQKVQLIAAFQEFLTSGHFIMGESLSHFEKKYAEFVKSEWCLGCANGTDTIELGLKALGIAEGDSVITTPLTAMPTLMGIAATGAKIKLCDVERETGLMDPALLESAFDITTKAVVPVHLYGQICDMERIFDFVRKRKISLLEDCAQAHGAKYNDLLGGSWGNLASWSYYPTKNIGALGDAGSITGNSPELFERLRKLRNYGQSQLYHHDSIGRNSRLDELQAAFLTVKLSHFEAELNKRNQIARIYYTELSKKVKIITGSLDSKRNSEASFHLFVIESPYEREDFRKRLHDQGIQTLIHYPVPAHLQGAFQFLGFKKGDFPVAEYLSEKIISIPLNPYMTDHDVDLVISGIANVC